MPKFVITTIETRRIVFEVEAPTMGHAYQKSYKDGLVLSATTLTERLEPNTYAYEKKGDGHARPRS